MSLGGCVVVGGVAYGPAPAPWRNWHDGEVHFKSRKRVRPVTHAVVHESVTRTRKATVRTLQRKGYGVHVILGPAGDVTQHADLLDDVVAHGNLLNGRSIGVEVVNPYEPHKRGDFPGEVVPAEPWTFVAKGRARGYVRPTPAQVAALAALMRFLRALRDRGVLQYLPHASPMVGATGLYVPGRRKEWLAPFIPPPGWVAHGAYSTHADGHYPLGAALVLGGSFVT